MNLDNNKSAKDYIFEAYSQELKAIQEKSKLLETPASILEKEKLENTLKLAEEVLAMNILNEEITSEYTELNKKIQSKKDNILKLYGIEIDDNSLQAIKNSYNVVANNLAEYLQNNREEFEKSQKEQLDEVMEKISQNNDITSDKINAIYVEINDKITSNKIETQREQAEYDYNLKRSRKQAKEDREKIIFNRKKELQLKEDTIKEQKQLCLDKLKEIDDLQAKVDSIPTLIENAKLEGATQKEKELGKDYGYKSAMAKKDNDNQIANLQDEYNRLESKYQQLVNEKVALSNKLDKCYAESRQLATDTVKSTGGINILNADNQNGYSKK